LAISRFEAVRGYGEIQKYGVQWNVQQIQLDIELDTYGYSGRHSMQRDAGCNGI